MRAMRTGIWAAAALVLGSLAFAGAPGNPVQLDIASQPLVDALNRFADQTGLQVLVNTDEVAAARIVAPEVRGQFTPSEGLERLLERTGLKYEFVNDRTVRIAPLGAPTAAVSEHSSLRLAQIPASSKQSSSAEPESGSQNTFVPHTQKRDLENLEEIVVTGTHIRGIAPIGSLVRVYTREDIDRTGAATLQQFARQMIENLPNMDAVANPHSNVGRAQLSQTARNVFSGAGFNLRGVGPSATLTLLDGHRLAPAGDDGSFTDISQIPLSAIDHVEVMADGASALYGSDAVAGVVNIITRKSLSGAETALSYASASGGGAIDRTASQLLGGAWGGGSVLLNYEYSEQEGLDAAQRDYLPPQGGTQSLIAPTRRNSALASLRQQIGVATTLSASATYSNRNFRSRSVFASDLSSFATGESGEATQTGATLAVDHGLGRDWNLNLTGNYSKVEQTFASIVEAGLLIQDTDTRADSSISGIDALATGPIGSLAAREISAALGAGYRAEKFENSSRSVSTFDGQEFPPFDSAVPADRRNVKSLYGELSIPLARSLDLSLAARYDDYSDFGSTLDPRVGLSWKGVPGLELRASYGESFKAALLSQLSVTRPPGTIFVFSGPNLADVIALQGGNPNLDAESSTSFTAGVSWVPPVLPGLKAALTYFDIEFEDRIAQPPISGGLYDLADPLLTPFITPASPELVQSFFDDPAFTDGTQLGPDAVEAILDIRYANIAAVEQSGLDLSAAYGMPVSAGRLDLSLAVTRLLDNDYQTVTTGPFIALLNQFAQPPKLRGRGTVVWSHGRFAASATINHVNRYDNNLVLPVRSIDSWTTADLHLSYRTEDAVAGPILDDITLALTVSNITNARPPSVEIPPLAPGENPLPFDPVNADPVGRLISLFISKKL